MENYLLGIGSYDPLFNQSGRRKADCNTCRIMIRNIERGQWTSNFYKVIDKNPGITEVKSLSLKNWMLVKVKLFFADTNRYDVMCYSRY